MVKNLLVNELINDGATLLKELDVRTYHRNFIE